MGSCCHRWIESRLSGIGYGCILCIASRNWGSPFTVVISLPLLCLSSTPLHDWPFASQMTTLLQFCRQMVSGNWDNLLLWGNLSLDRLFCNNQSWKSSNGITCCGILSCGIKSCVITFPRITSCG